MIGLMSRWVRFVDLYARQVLLLLILLTIAAGYYSYRYSRINSDVSTLIKPSAELQWHRDNEYYKKAFPDLQQTAVVVVSGSENVAVEDVAKHLVREFQQLAEFPFVFAPAIGDFLNSRKLYFLDESTLDQWITAAEYNYGPLLRLADSAGMTNAVFTFADQVASIRGLPIPSTLASIAETFDPKNESREIDLKAYPRLIDESVEKHYQLIVLKVHQEHDRSLPHALIVEKINSVIDSIPVKEGVSVRVTGEVVLANDELNAGLKGIGIAGGLSFVLLGIILGVGIRSWRIISVIFTMLLMGVVLTMAFATLAIGGYNVLSLIFVVMFFGLGVDFAVHFALRVREAAAATGPEDASIVAARDIGPALALCMLTTMIAFLSFSPTAYRGLAELGVISAGGMVVAFTLTLTLLPAMFSLLGISSKEMPKMVFNRLISIDLKINPSIILVTVVGLSLIAFNFARDIKFDYSVLAMRDASTEGMTTLLDLQRDKISTDYSISVLAKDPESAEILKEALKELSVVGEVSTPHDFIPEAQAQKKEKLEALLELYHNIEEILPAESTEGLSDALQYMDESITQVRDSDKHLVDFLRSGLTDIVDDEETLTRLNLQLFEQLNIELKSLKKMLAASPFTIDAVPADLRKSMITSAGEHLLTVHPAKPLTSRQKTEEFIDEVSSVAPNIAGRSVVEWGIGGVVVESFIFAGTGSLIAIFLLLLVYFRNFVLPLFVFVPIFLSILFTFAICQLTGISLNMANILVVPLIIGLGVDTGIHVVHRYTHSNSVESLYTSSTARAVLISALTTIGTFFSLSFSPHKGAASVGLLLTIAISLLILATFVVLPALLRVSRIGNKADSIS